ncbi:uncharacterized protein LOC143034567 isoform X1 [Oratosquilla oratoria]|uniref:uncharacterized protein LOC143034567 isoform X1 n=1 Tax=Oratosquilla oratoria TaxID=337810 RepID=UPI003F770754
MHCVQHHYKTGSFKKVQDALVHQFECGKAPGTVDSGTVENHNAANDNRPSHSGRPRKRTAELIESVRESVQLSPKRSVCKRSQSLGISRETCRRVPVMNVKA